jgi:hypothetical protein
VPAAVRHAAERFKGLRTITGPCDDLLVGYFVFLDGDSVLSRLV